MKIIVVTMEIDGSSEEDEMRSNDGVVMRNSKGRDE